MDHSAATTANAGSKSATCRYMNNEEDHRKPMCKDYEDLEPAVLTATDASGSDDSSMSGSSTIDGTPALSTDKHNAASQERKLADNGPFSVAVVAVAESGIIGTDIPSSYFAALQPLLTDMDTGLKINSWENTAQFLQHQFFHILRAIIGFAPIASNRFGANISPRRAWLFSHQLFTTLIPLLRDAAGVEFALGSFARHPAFLLPQSEMGDTHCHCFARIPHFPGDDIDRPGFVSFMVLAFHGGYFSAKTGDSFGERRLLGYVGALLLQRLHSRRLNHYKYPERIFALRVHYDFVWFYRVEGRTELEQDVVDVHTDGTGLFTAARFPGTDEAPLRLSVLEDRKTIFRIMMAIMMYGNGLVTA